VHALLARYGDAARLLAGGQSLVPALNMRLATPSVLIDINGLAELGRIEPTAGGIAIGALVRHAQLERSACVATAAPLLIEAIAHVAHPAIRTRGTVGGSIALADPAAELPACCLALDAVFMAASPAGERRIAAQAFFSDMFETALAADEILLGVHVPQPGPGAHHAFYEIARRHGDYATAGLALTAHIADGVATRLRLAFFGVERRPRLVLATAQCLVGAPLDAPALARAREALRAELEPLADGEHAADTKLQLAEVVLERALARLPLARRQ
jgi:carbon-monoxide dehydrogenase medium subunit